MATMHLVAPALLFAATLSAQASFTDFASGPVQPLRLSADGLRLFAADTTAGNLCVFDLGNPSAPLLLAEIQVGLDPVAVNPRTDDEVWVCNQLSDSVSIVSLRAGCVVATLPTGDEPSDVVFAGGKAFVSCATTDSVQVFDVATRQLVGTVAVFGKDPRALAASADGSRVYAVVQRSGNGTTVIPEGIAPPPPPPTNPALPPAPQQGILVRADDPQWSTWIQFQLPDRDVAEISVSSLQVSRYFDHVGTTNTGIAVHPLTGELWVTNTEALNLVRFEPNLRGHAIDNRVTRIGTGPVPTVQPIDLNPGLNYGSLPNAAALGTALSDPFGIAIDAATNRIYVAAQGTDRIGVLDHNGAVLARIEVGNTPGSSIDTRHKRGPRGLALHPTAPRLYVQNHLSSTITVIDTATLQVLRELPLGSVDPIDPLLRQGRNFLYDAKLSGNGTLSCASCHVDGDTDGLAWDLGDPMGTMLNPPAQPFPFNLGLTAIHPMKGPRTTQTLRGIGGSEPLHWGGDRSSFAAFNPAFASLLGGAVLPTADMDDFAAYAVTIALPPNPNQPLDRSYRTSPANNNQAAGLAAFTATATTLPLIGAVSCNTCHALPTGSNRRIVSAQVLMETQQMKVPQLRNLYRKVGFSRGAGAQKSGFGYTKDGAVDTLTSFLNLVQFNNWPNAQKDDLATFLISFDTGTAPMVGHQLTVDSSNANGAAVASALQLLTARAQAGDCDGVARGQFDGRLAGLLYQPSTGLWLVDRSGEAPLSTTALLQRAGNGTALLTFTGVPVGSGVRLALDRDGDGTRDGDDGLLGYGADTPGCAGAPLLTGNSKPRVGNSAFAVVVRGAPASSAGALLLGLRAASAPVAGITLLVDPLGAPVVLQFLPSDVRGVAASRQPMPATPSLAGLSLFAQAAFVDNCAPGGLAASAGLRVTVRP